MDSKKHRILSIDALRGFDMMWIMGFGLFLRYAGRATGTDVGSVISDHMEHVPWDGLHQHDLIFPIFIFLAGASWPFSLAAQRAKGISEKQILLRVFKRFVLLFTLGLLTSGIMRFDFVHMRYMSVLGRIACAWLVASLTLMFCGPRKTVFVAALVLVGYYLSSRFVPGIIEPGCDPWAYGTSVLVMFEKWIMPYHFYNWGGEGILSAFFGASGCAYFGIFSGLLLQRTDWTEAKKSVMLAVFSLALSIAAFFASFICPCVKNLWSLTFVLMASAIAMAWLSLFHWLIDVKGWTKWSFFFRVIGMNAITIYLLRNFVDFNTPARRLFNGFIKMAPDHWTQAVTAGFSFVVGWALLYFLYRKKIFLKV